MKKTYIITPGHNINEPVTHKKIKGDGVKTVTLDEIAGDRYVAKGTLIAPVVIKPRKSKAKPETK